MYRPSKIYQPRRPSRTHFFGKELPLQSLCEVERIHQVEPGSNMEFNYTIFRSNRNNFLPRLGDAPKANFWSTTTGVKIIPSWGQDLSSTLETLSKRQQEAEETGKVLEVTTEEAEMFNIILAPACKRPPPSYIKIDALQNDFLTAQNYTKEHQIADLSWYDDFYPEPEMGDSDYFDFDLTSANSCIIPGSLRNYLTVGGIEANIPKTFTCFPKLPKKLRLKILKFVVFTPRAVAVRCMEFAPNERKSILYGIPWYPFTNKVEKSIRILQTKTSSAAAILQVNQELRNAALDFYDLCYGTLIYKKEYGEYYNGDEFSFPITESDFLVKEPMVHINFVSDTMYLEQCKPENAFDHLLEFDRNPFLPIGSIRSIAFDLWTLTLGYVGDYARIVENYPNIKEIIFVARLNHSQLESNEAGYARTPSLARGNLEFVDLRKEETLMYYERYIGDFYDRLWGHEFFDEIDGEMVLTDYSPWTDLDMSHLQDDTWWPKIRVMGLLSNGKRI